MDNKDVKRVGAYWDVMWTILAALVVTGVLTSFKFETLDFIFVASIACASFSTFVCARLGIQRLNRFRYSRAKGAGIGFLYGGLALILSAILLFLMILLAELTSGNFSGLPGLFFGILYLGFILGGFLGPVCGLITGIILATQLENRWQEISKKITVSPDV